MRVHSLCQSIFLLSLLLAPILAVDDKTVFHVVGTGECADCKDNNFEPSQALSGLHVTIDCKIKDGGDMKRVASGELDEKGKFEVSLPKEVFDGQKLKHECCAQLHSAAATPCPLHGGLQASKIVFKSVENGKLVFTPNKKMQFSAALCTSKFLWPKFNFPPLPKTHPWLKNFGQPWSYPPLPPLYKHKPILPPIPIYKPLPPPVPIYKPPVVKPLPPPVPIYKPPVVKPLPPPVPIYKPPVVKPPKTPCPPTKPKPPVSKPPKKPCPPTKSKPPKVKPLPPPVPIYKPPIVKPLPPPLPIYKPPIVKPLPPPLPIYKPPIVKPLPPPVPIYKPPIVKPLPPPIPIYKPPFYKKPCPPFPQLPPLPKLPPFPPKYYKHPKWGHFPPISPVISHP